MDSEEREKRRESLLELRREKWWGKNEVMAGVGLALHLQTSLRRWRKAGRRAIFVSSIFFGSESEK